jgi:molybdopterin-guanine dinucleotide biosynthesis protein A
MVFMCAGSSLRFGEDKFLCPIGKDQTSILDLMFMRLRRNTNGISIPIILNCSVSNQKKIQNYLISKHFFGF